ncbi:MAG: Nif3-like dinuclear metal center hexameric protein [Pirellula sp.]
MQRLHSILQTLDDFAPLSLAESWDNVGLLVGEADAWVRRVMVCLTVTETTLREAIERNANLIISHHPIPFKPLHRITDQTPTGRLIVQAIRHEVAIYSPHTAWDNAPRGINRQLAECLGLDNLAPLTLSPDASHASRGLGSGLQGNFPVPQSIDAIFEKLQSHIPSARPRCTHDGLRQVSQIAMVCGSGGSLVSLAAKCGCDAFLTGEATYHQCLEAEAYGMALLMIGHHASEFFSLSTLAAHLQSCWPDVEFCCSEREHSTF